MLPVLTSPRGSKKDIFMSLASSTLYELRASGNEPVFEAITPLDSVLDFPLLSLTILLLDCTFVRTKSAQDLGVDFGGGEPDVVSGFEMAWVSCSLS